MSTIFVSHSSKDNAIALQLASILKQLGYHSLFLDFDPDSGLIAGEKWEQEIYTKLNRCQALIAVVSDNWLKSKWCFAEAVIAKSRGKAIFPVRVGACERPRLLAEFQEVDFTRDSNLDALCAGLKAKGLDWNATRPPYPGLFAFEEEDAAVFFGRQSEIDHGLEILRRMQRGAAGRLLLVLGPSGSGKSSVLRAGLIPQLRLEPAEQWILTHPIRPARGASAQLAVALSLAFERHGQRKAPAEIERALCTDHAALNRVGDELATAAGRLGASVLVSIDQTEELLTGEDNSRFLAHIRAAIEDPHSRCIIAATLRSDFFSSFQQHAELRTASFESLPIGPMSAERFREVISGPAQKAGVTLDEDLAEQLAADAEVPDALPLLAVVLHKLWECGKADAVMRTRDYSERLGGLEVWRDLSLASLNPSAAL